MESEQPSSEKDNKNEKENKDNITKPPQKIVLKIQKKKDSPKCQGCPYRQQCLQAAKQTGPSIEEQIKKT